ncbi:hypothetical protein DQ04_05891000 [Trypanosoma grayi]|uniref:hypothetical protein n=1 Tax=Trypanosoma grayi TaxID=71804 RepID=UPI0004F4BE3D|nr:hypothetical protein DQ04_05891000 [Trypanosoma grayi]KEG09066.1 hypothetical protein DQ04_05891000 [Trypanosoma grayi]
MHRLGLGLLWRQPRLHREVMALSGVLSVSLRKGGPWVPNRADKLNQRGCFGSSGVLFRDICQMGSLAGAAYLLHDNAGVLRRAQWEQKSHVEHKRKSLLD